MSLAHHCRLNTDPPPHLLSPTSRGLFESIDAEAAAAAAAAQRRVGRAAEYHVPDVLVSAHLRHLLLPQWRHLLHHQNRRIHSLQLRVYRRLHGTALRVQGSGRFLSPFTGEDLAGAGQHRRWRHGGRHPGGHSVNHFLQLRPAAQKRAPSQQYGGSDVG